MKDKYLTIGSVVTVNNINKKIMIVGYYAIKYQNVVKMYDYLGISYPEGTLVEGSYAFNHSDISSILFEGYLDDSFKILNRNMLGQNEEKNNNLKNNDKFVNVKYDANGVVQYDEFNDNSVKKLVELLNGDNVENPFKTPSDDKTFKEVLPVVEEQNNNSINDTIITENTQNIIDNLNIALDENKINNTSEVVNIDIPTYKFTEDGIIIND